jgi:apolipoprotein N-acyltransferase
MCPGASSEPTSRVIMKPVLLHVSAMFLSLAGGVLVSLAFPPWNQDWLIWIGFIPVLAGLLLFPRGWVASLLQGAIFGGTFGGLVFSWLWAAGQTNDWIWNFLSLGLLGGIWGIFVGLFVQLPAKSGSQQVSPILPGYGFNSAAWTKSVSHLRLAFVTASAWTVLEWGRGALLPGWNAVGTVLQANLPLLQTATVTGASGLSFIAVFANFIALAVVRRIVLEPGRMTWASRFDVTATLGVVFVTALAGFWTLQHHPASEGKKIALVCPETTDFGRLLELSEGANERGIDLFVWRSVRFGQGDYTRLGDASIGVTSGLVAGMTSAENGFLNGASIIIPGAVKNLFLMPRGHDHFQPGSSGRTLNPFSFKDTSWIPLVNWEAGDPRVVRAVVNKQIQVIIALVDPLSGGPGSTEQLFSNLRLWSVSCGRPMIFASTRSFAAIVSRSGKLVADARLTPGTDILIGNVEVPAPFDSTLYGRYGDWFAVACGAIAIVTAISERLRRFHEKPGRFSA